MAEVLKTIDYNGLKIEVTLERNSVRFFVKTDVNDGRWFESLDGAKTYADQHLSRKNAYKARTMDVAIRLMDSDGVTFEFNGINRRDGDARVSNYNPPRKYGYRAGQPEKSTSFRGNAYPNEPWVRELLEVQRNLQAQLKKVEDELHNVEVHIGERVGYGNRGISIDHYPRVMEELVAKIEKALAYSKKKVQDRALESAIAS